MSNADLSEGYQALSAPDGGLKLAAQRYGPDIPNLRDKFVNKVTITRWFLS